MRKAFFIVIILVIASFAFLAGSRYGRDQISYPDSKTERQVLYYTDPMTPGFRSDKPGIAPCGMPLEPVYAEADEGFGAETVSMSPGAVKINSGQRQLAGVQVAAVELKPLTYTLRLYGKVVPDETKIHSINTSTDVWVRTLTNITTGSLVSSNQILAEVLDQDFYTAQVTYLVSLGNLERNRKQLGQHGNPRLLDLADNQMRVAVQDLLDLGISEAQVQELAETRKAQPLLQVRSPVNGVVLERNLTLYQWIKAGVEFYRIADISSVWVYADVYEDEAMYLRPGMEVKIAHGQLGTTFTAKVGQVLPLFDPVAKTLKVRLDVDNSRYDLRPDMFVDVLIPISMPASLHVPVDAVIDSGARTVVYVDIGNSTFEPRLVETGSRRGRQIEITRGLMAGEKVVVAGNFLVDSESRMRTASGMLVATTDRDPVCGMDVDIAKADQAGNSVTHEGKTYYFCMPECREKFEKDPEKFVRRMPINGYDTEHDAMAGQNQSWREMLEPDPGSQGTKDSGPLVGERTGWDDFMGAKHFGVKQMPQQHPVQQDDMPGMAGENAPGVEEVTPGSAPASPSAAHHQGMNHDMGETQTAQEPEQSPSR